MQAVSPSIPPVQEVKNTTCYMCACRCGIRVHLRDGEVRYIDGNPEHPINRGVICAKGASGIMKQYSPARLTLPLKRKAAADIAELDVDGILVSPGPCTPNEAGVSVEAVTRAEGV